MEQGDEVVIARGDQPVARLVPARPRGEREEPVSSITTCQQNSSLIFPGSRSRPGRRGVTYLLDAHALLWALTDPASLGTQARRVMADADQPCRLGGHCVGDLHEAAARQAPQADAIVSTYARALDRLGASEPPITAAHAILARKARVGAPRPSTACSRPRP